MLGNHSRMGRRGITGRGGGGGGGVVGVEVEIPYQIPLIFMRGKWSFYPSQDLRWSIIDSD